MSGLWLNGRHKLIGAAVIAPIFIVPVALSRAAREGWAPNPMVFGIGAFVYALCAGLFFYKVSKAASQDAAAKEVDRG